MFFIETSYVKH